MTLARAIEMIEEERDYNRAVAGDFDSSQVDEASVAVGVLNEVLGILKEVQG